MPLMRRGPGLVGAAARTAVVAGTATAVSGRVSRRQQQRYAQQEYEQEQQAYAPPAPAAAPADPDDPVAQIEKLGALQQQGLITPEEFAAMKAKILAG